MTPFRNILSTFPRLTSPHLHNYLLHTKPLHPSYIKASRVIGMVKIFEQAKEKVFRPVTKYDESQEFITIPGRVSELKKVFEKSPDNNKTSKPELRSKPYPKESFDNREEFEERLNDIADVFKNHPAINHPLFSYLAEQSDSGFNKMQYAIFYTNFLFRTKETIPSVAYALARAALEGDYSTVAMHGKNLGDETGYGNPDNVHSQLLMDTHNVHGKRVFDLDPLTIQDLKTSILITPEVREYCEMKAEIFRKSYPHIAGNMWAHEFAADDMLTNFKEAYFEPYKSHYSEEEYEKLMKFFDAHRDDSVDGGDVEAEHERMARQAVYFACKGDIRKLDAVLEGGLMMLDCQAKVWDSILRETQKFENWMEKVAPIHAGVKDEELESNSLSTPVLSSTTRFTSPSTSSSKTSATSAISTLTIVQSI